MYLTGSCILARARSSRTSSPAGSSMFVGRRTGRPTHWRSAHRVRRVTEGRLHLHRCRTSRSPPAGAVQGTGRRIARAARGTTHAGEGPGGEVTLETPPPRTPLWCDAFDAVSHASGMRRCVARVARGGVVSGRQPLNRKTFAQPGRNLLSKLPTSCRNQRNS